MSRSCSLFILVAWKEQLHHSLIRSHYQSFDLWSFQERQVQITFKKYVSKQLAQLLNTFLEPICTTWSCSACLFFTERRVASFILMIFFTCFGLELPPRLLKKDASNSFIEVEWLNEQLHHSFFGLFSANCVAPWLWEHQQAICKLSIKWRSTSFILFIIHHFSCYHPFNVATWQSVWIIPFFWCITSFILLIAAASTNSCIICFIRFT